MPETTSAPAARTGICSLCKEPRASHPKHKRPSVATMERWMDNGIAPTPDGCEVEPDGTCEHGFRSWLVIFGMI